MSMTEPPPPLLTPGNRVWPRIRRTAVSVLLALWIFGISAFFFIRFTSVVYASKRGALDGLLDALLN